MAARAVPTAVATTLLCLSEALACLHLWIIGSANYVGLRSRLIGGH